jgi:hypothetical protein
MVWIFTPFQISACCMFCGPVMFTNFGARSSPEVVTTILKSPRFTLATTTSSAGPVPRAINQAPGMPMSTSRMTIVRRRVEKSRFSIRIPAGWAEGIVAKGGRDRS